MATRGAMAKKYCQVLDIPWTIHTRIAWQVVMQCEGGEAKNNPCNTTWPMEGATDYNSVHVKNYLSATDGVIAVKNTFTIRPASRDYQRMLEAFRNNEPASVIVKLWGETNWGTGKTLMAQVQAWVTSRWHTLLRQLEQKPVAN